MLRQMRIDLRLTLSFLALLLLLGAFGLFSLRETRELSGLTEKLYHHPFTVGTNLRDVRGDITAMHRDMKDVAVAQPGRNLEDALRAVTEGEADVLRRLDLVEKRFLGDPERIREFRREFIAWRPIRDEVEELSRAGRHEEAIAITQGKGAQYVQTLGTQLAGLIDFANGKANQFHDNSLAEAATSFRAMTVFFAVAMLTSGFIVVFLFHSMADRRKREESLRKSEENLAITLRSIGDAVIATDVSGAVVRMNPVAEGLTGWSLAEAQGKSLGEVFHIINEETRAEVENPVAKVLRQGCVVGLANHTLLISRGGTEWPIADSAAPIVAADGKTVLGVVMVFRDQSEEREAERQIRHLNLVLRSIRDVNQLITHETDVRMLLEGACRCLTRTRGYHSVWVVALDGERKATHAAESGVGERFAELVRQMESGELPKCARLAIDGENICCIGKADAVCYACCLMPVDGVGRSLAAPLRHEGELLGVICAMMPEAVRPNEEELALFGEVASDLAYALYGLAQEGRRRQAEADLEKQKELLDLTGRMAKVGGWEFDVLTGEGTWTDEVARIHDLEPGAPTNAKLGLSMYEAEDRAKIEAAIEAAAKHGTPYELELELISAKGERKWVRTCGRPIREDGKVVRLAGTFQDITERRQMELRLRQREKMEAVGQLAGGIAHDFNNQLTGIMGYADLLYRNLSEQRFVHYAENILISSRRAADLTGQLLAFSRKGKFLSMPVDVHGIVTEVARFLRHSIDKRIEIKQVLSANPSTVIGDPSQLQNAILNLALNSRDAMPDGGELIFATRVTELGRRAFDLDLAEGPYIEISVTDTGCGIPENVRSRIFEPFFTTKDPGKGTGLGLASVFGTVKNHRGTVTLYSEVGKGTTFKIYLPVVEDLSMLREAPSSDTGPSLRDVRILVIDDELVVCELAADMLRGVGCKVITYTDPEKALEYYRLSSSHIDLVILDMVMPRLGGRALFVAMREINPAIHALLSSGYSINGEAQGILDEGVLGFVQKPYQMRELIDAVASALGRK